MLESLEKVPFMTLGKYLDQEYLGIIGNSDQSLLSMYIFNNIHSDELKKEFLRLGDIWWWETNRKVPINIALKQEWAVFPPILKIIHYQRFSDYYRTLYIIGQYGIQANKKKTNPTNQKNLTNRLYQ